MKASVSQFNVAQKNWPLHGYFPIQFSKPNKKYSTIIHRLQHCHTTPGTCTPYQDAKICQQATQGLVFTFQIQVGFSNSRKSTKPSNSPTYVQAFYQ